MFRCKSLITDVVDSNMCRLINRCLLIFFISILVSFAAPTHTSYAFVEIDVVKGDIRPFPIAIPSFLDRPGSRIGSLISKMIRDNLEHSGLFLPIDRMRYLDDITDINKRPEFDNWRSIKAEELLIGRVVWHNVDKIGVEFRLWDVISAQQMASQKLFATPENWQRLAHAISDIIYHRLIGETGYFDTKIVFVSESGTKKHRVKRLAIMDQNGDNFHYLTDGKDLVLTPRFSRSGREVIYTSLGSGQLPQTIMLDIISGQHRTISNSHGMSFSPRFLPDGRGITMSMQINENANIYTMNLINHKTIRLTNTKSLDTSPSYSPTGKYLTFASDRNGRQQIYVMNADGSSQHRISSGKGHYSTPVWSPRGDMIAFTKQIGSRFQIGVMRPDGKGERILTDGFHNEGPTWAPNGRVLMFFRDIPGTVGGPRIWSIDLTGRHERRIKTPEFASDPSWSPLLD